MSNPHSYKDNLAWALTALDLVANGLKYSLKVRDTDDANTCSAELWNVRTAMRSIKAALEQSPPECDRDKIIEECAEAIEGCLKERQPSDFYAAVVRALKNAAPQGSTVEAPARGVNGAFASQPPAVAALWKAANVFRQSFHYDPGHSDLDNEQPITITVMLGSWRDLDHALNNAAPQVPNTETPALRERPAVAASPGPDDAAKDAARYRWLRDTGDHDFNRLLRDGGDAMDAEIDAAMAQSCATSNTEGETK